MLNYEPAALDRHICDGPKQPRRADVECLACGQEFTATATRDMGTVDLDPGACPGCRRDDSLAVVS